MKVVEFDRFGLPEEVVACIEQATPAPAAGEILVEVEAFPINPADLLQIEGRYAVRPQLPARLGAECCGLVTALGAGVDGFAVGDRVMVMARENWASHRCIPAAQAMKLPREGDPLQYAMLKVNPATAELMLTEYVRLGPGDWVIQNAGNSAVAAALIRIAKARGWRTANVVRREDAAATVLRWGGDAALVDGDDLAARVEALTDGRPPMLAIDAIGGSATTRLAQAAAPGATIVNYGLLSGEACRMEPADLIFRRQTLTGFWLGGVLGGMARADVEGLYGRLAEDVRAGRLAVEIEAVYGIADIAAAVGHAGRAGRAGKVLVRPNA